MVTDAQRRELHASLVGTLGEGPAETMMQLLPPFDWEEVARRTDVADLGVALRGEMSELRGEMATLGSELRGEMGELRTELRAEMSELRIELRGEMAELKGELKDEMGEIRGQIGELRGQMGEMRGELLGLGHRLDSQLAKLVVANLGTSAAFAGLVFGAIRLAA